MKEKRKQTIYKFTSIVLCLALISIAILLVFSPIIKTKNFSLLPYDLIISISINDLNFGSLDELMVSYYLNKYYFMLYATVLVISLFLLIYYSFFVVTLSFNPPLYQPCFTAFHQCTLFYQYVL
jgi:hypothetical protein